MTVLLINYDLSSKDPHPAYDKILNFIKGDNWKKLSKTRAVDTPDSTAKYQGYVWAELSESSYAIVTNELPAAIYKKLDAFAADTEGKSQLGSKDVMNVIKLAAPCYVKNYEVVRDWLTAHLQPCKQ